MPEILLHTIWLHGLFRDFPQTTTDGRPVQVLDPGQHNLDAGPDFSAATICLGDLRLAGNIEMHIKASDWFRHGHHTDPAYDSVILHVVREADKETVNSKGERIPTLVLRYPDDPAVLEQLLAEHSWFCSIRWDKAVGVEAWKAALLADRIHKKELAIRQLLSASRGDWNEAFYITLAHNFGFHTNSLPFELLAKQTPLPYLLKHRNSLFQLTAMLLGQSGLLKEDDPLFREYSFLQKKFTLVPLNGSIWKMARMRPQNFPQVRIRQFAQLIHDREHLLSEILQTSDLKQLRKLFEPLPADAGNNCQLSTVNCQLSEAPLGRTAIDTLLINVAVPYKYAWGRTHNMPALCDEALELLRRIPAERNHIVDEWKTLGIPLRSAADSQAFIHLYNEYCIRQRCLSCDLGLAIYTPEEK